MTEKALPPRGMYGYYRTGEVWVKISVDANGKIEVTSDDLTTILTKIGASSDAANMADGLFAGQEALWDNIHSHIGIIVADKSSAPVAVTLIKIELEKKYKVSLLDDDDIDLGNADLEVYDIFFVAAGITDMTKINNLTTLGVPILTGNAEVALTILKMGDDSGGSGTGWGAAASETQVNIVDNSHQITLEKDEGNNTVYSEVGSISWIRASDVVGTCVELAEISGDSTKSVILVLPYDEADEDGTAAPMPRIFWGIVDPTKWNTATEAMFYEMMDWALHQGRRTVEVEGLGKINQVKALLEDTTYGLSALETLVDDIEGKTNNLPTDPADASVIAADFDRHLTPLDFWGDPIVTVQISTSTAVKSLGIITVSTLPSGATIWKVQLIGFISYIVDTSGSDNAINGAVTIQVQDDGGGSWIDAFDIKDNALLVDVSQSKVRPGIPVVGNLNDHDLSGSGYVDGADTYNVQITTVVSDGDNLDLYGLQFGLRVWIF